MKITREQLKTIVGEVLQEEEDYQAYFKAMLKKHGVTSPAQFKTDAEKKAFFDKVESGWKGVSERIGQVRTEQAARIEQLRKEEEEKEAELAEINGKIDSAIEALESLRPVSEEKHEETPPMQQSEVPFQEAKWKKK
jgi:hypothetical protein